MIDSLHKVIKRKHYPLEVMLMARGGFTFDLHGSLQANVSRRLPQNVSPHFGPLFFTGFEGLK